MSMRWYSWTRRVHRGKPRVEEVVSWHARDHGLLKRRWFGCLKGQERDRVARSREPPLERGHGVVTPGGIQADERYLTAPCRIVRTAGSVKEVWTSGIVERTSGAVGIVDYWRPVGDKARLSVCLDPLEPIWIPGILQL